MSRNIIQIVDNLSYSSGVMNVIMNYYILMSDKYKYLFLYYEDCDQSYKKEIKKLGGYTKKITKPNYLNFNKICNEIKNESYFLEKNYLVHIHVPVFAFYFILMFKYGLSYQGIFIVHAHSNKFSDTIIKNVRNRLFIEPLRYMNFKKIACSESANESIFGKKNKEDCLILKNAIDFDLYLFDIKERERIRKYLNIENMFVLGHVGRLAKEKNHLFLLNILNKILKFDENIVMIFIGDGVEKKALIKRAKELDVIKHMVFIKSNNEIYNYLQAFDIFLFPSLFEGLGLSLIEAQASGLKCIASTNVPKESSISNDTLYLDLDEELWLEKIIEIKRNDYEHVFKSNNNKTGFDIKEQVKKLEELYEKYI